MIDRGLHLGSPSPATRSQLAAMAPPAAGPPGGGGNIKVVVRVRPFNGRGQAPCSLMRPPCCVAAGLRDDDANVTSQNTTETQNVSSR